MAGSSLALAVLTAGCGGCDKQGSSTRPSDPEGGLKLITTEGGGLVLLPAKPRARATEPSEGCVRGRVVGPRGPTTALLPPKPGLRAKRVGETLIVTYELPGGLNNCRPWTLRLTIASSNGRNLSITRPYRLRVLRGSQRVRVPAYFDDPPDIVHGSTATRDDLRSPVASVSIG